MKSFLLTIISTFLISTLSFGQYDYFKIYTDSIVLQFYYPAKLETHDPKTILRSGGFNFSRLEVFNSQGQIEWSKFYDSDSSFLQYSGRLSIREIAAKPNGNFLAVGQIATDGLIVELDSLGNVLWAKQYAHPSGIEHFHKVIVTANGEHLVANGSRILKLDNTGNILWAKTLIPQSVAGSSNGNSALIENSVGYLYTFGGGVIIQLDFNGNVIWANNYPLTIHNMFLMNNDDIVIIGDVQYTASNSNRVWMRMNNVGTPLWTKRLPGTLNSNWVGNSNNGYRLGTDKNVDYLRWAISANNTDKDIIFAKLNTTTGQVEWGKRHIANLSINYSFFELNDYIALSDTSFSIFAYNALAAGSQESYNFKISAANTSNTTTCIVQDEPFPITYDTTIQYTSIPINSQNMTYIVTNPTIYVRDLFPIEYILCENGVKANFKLSDATLCQDDCLNALDFSSGNIIGWEWAFMGNDTTYSYTQSPPTKCYPDSGLYSIRLVVTNGTLTDTLKRTVQVIPQPQINLGQDTAICDGNFFVLLPPTIPNATYAWSTGETTPYSFVQDSGFYHLEVTVGPCIANDFIYVEVLEMPIIDLGLDTAFCTIDSLFLDATFPNCTYFWQDGTTDAQLIAMISGNYSVTVTNSLGCEVVDDINLVFNNFPPTNLGNDTTICQGDSIMIDVYLPNATYLWNNNSTDSILTTNIGGIYIVEITKNDCFNSDTININIQNNPIVNLGNDTTFCNVDSFYVTAETGGNVTYLWNNGTVNSSIFTQSTGNYVVTVTDNFGCQTSDNINLEFINISPTDLGADSLICEGQMIVLEATSSTPNTNYLWSDNSNNSTLQVNQSGLYFVNISVGNCMISDSIFITTIIPSSVELGTNETLCNDDIFILDVNDSLATRYQWQDNSTLSSFEVNQGGTYFVQVFYNDNCLVSDTITFFPEMEITPTLPTDTIICENNSLVLNAYQPNAIAYQWQTTAAYYQQHNLTDSSITATLPGDYAVTISNECRSFTQYIEVIQDDCGCYPYIPDAFTPNDDGINDVFKIYANCPIEQYNLKIFDRWGGILLESEDIDEGWNGEHNGRKLKTGVYVWLLEYQATDNDGVTRQRIEKGSLTIIK